FPAGREGEDEAGESHERREKDQRRPAAEPVGIPGGDQGENRPADQGGGEDRPDLRLGEAPSLQLDRQDEAAEAVGEGADHPGGDEQPAVPAERSAHRASRRARKEPSFFSGRYPSFVRRNSGRPESSIALIHSKRSNTRQKSRKR